jgi:hypothetical protein
VIKSKIIDFLKHGLFILGILALLFVFIQKAQAKSSYRIVTCSDSKVMDIYVRPNFTTIVNFPIKPDNVVLGGKNLFNIEYIKNDLALTALTSHSNTNLFVYLYGRRCGFQLITSNQQQDSVIRVQDSDDIKLNIKNFK